MSTKFTPPPVYVGTVVIHVLEPGRPGVPGVVVRTSADGRLADLMLLTSKTLVAKSGCCHELDPQGSRERNPEGFWKLTETELELRALVEAATPKKRP